MLGCHPAAWWACSSITCRLRLQGRDCLSRRQCRASRRACTPTAPNPLRAPNSQLRCAVKCSIGREGSVRRLYCLGPRHATHRSSGTVSMRLCCSLTANSAPVSRSLTRWTVPKDPLPRSPTCLKRRRNPMMPTGDPTCRRRGFAQSSPSYHPGACSLGVSISHRAVGPVPVLVER